MQQSKKIMKKLELDELNEKSKIDMQNVKTDRQLATGTMEWRRPCITCFFFPLVLGFSITGDLLGFQITGASPMRLVLLPCPPMLNLFALSNT
jgi:hypothetical protein